AAACSPNVAPADEQFVLASFLETSPLPDWAIPAIGGGCALVVLFISYLVFGRRSEDAPPTWNDGRPVLRNYERQIQRANEAPRGSDQRSSSRRTGNPVDVQITDAEAKAPPTSAIVIDRSMRGLCIAVEFPERVGSIINVRPLTGGANMPW